MDIIKLLKSLTIFEKILWICSWIVITVSFFAGEAGSVISLAASLMGAVALIFLAKGSVWGQILTVIFSILYAIVSFQCRYYGEMITYLGMSMPVAAFSVFTWLRNPYSESEVKVGNIKKSHGVLLFAVSVLVTVAFYFILKFFNTANLIWSTISVFTSFMASSLSMLRSKFYAAWYALNDIVLMVLWVTASIGNIKFLPMVMCFVVFLVNDLYGFYQWGKMKRRQEEKD